MASGDSSQKRTLLADRLRNYFTRGDNGGLPQDDSPRRRGIAVSVCLLISATLWFTFTMQETDTVTVPMRTEITNLPADQALREPPPETVRVQVAGERIQLLRIYWDPPTVRINGTLDRVDLEDVVGDLPKNVSVLGISPQVIDLKKEQRIMKRVPVRLDASITIPPTHDLIDDIRLTPDSIDIAGAVSVVSQIRYWPTVPLRHKDLRDSLVATVALKDTLTEIVWHNPDYVVVSAVAREFTEGVREVDVNVRGIPSNDELVTLDPPTIKVRYRVLFSQYDEVQRAPDFYAEVSYDEILRDTTGRVRPNLHLPPDLEIRDVEMIPSTVGYFQQIGR